MDGEKVGYLLGADIGGTRIKLVLMNGSGKIVARSRIDTEAGGGPYRGLERLMEAARSLLTDHHIAPADLAGLGVGAAGPLDIARGVIAQAPNLPGWEGTPIADTLSRGLSVPVFLENDANLAAFGEYKLGAGRGADILVCFTLGTGVGGGIVIDGEIYTGALGAGAELGHITIDQTGPSCNCGNSGCLEALASASAVVRMAAEVLKEDRGATISELVGGDPGKVDAETVHQAALAGDGEAVEILARAGRSLGAGIASVVNIFAPRVVVLGGGLMRAGEFILRPAREEAMRRVLKSFAAGLSIVPAELGGSAGAIGAACYAMHKMKDG